MQDVDLNYVAIVVAAIAPMAVGALWYSPRLFARQWMRAVGRTEEDLRGGAGIGYAVALVASFVMSYALARVARWAEADGIVEGVIVAVLAWSGFVATVLAVNTTFAGRPRNLWAIDGGYWLVSLLIMGAIHGAWD